MALVIGRCKICKRADVVCLRQFHYETLESREGHGLMCFRCSPHVVNKLGVTYGKTYADAAETLLREQSTSGIP